jgi:hypothetical protein
MGLMFADRRTAIDVDAWEEIIREGDGYRPLLVDETPREGDVAIYRLNGAVAHVALVLSARAELATASMSIVLLSQWGFDGEYIHPPTEVPELYGAVAEYWTDRKPRP